MQQDKELLELQAAIAVELPLVQTVFAQLETVVIGQPKLLELLMIGALTNGHLLLEGVPGVAKTLAITSFAKAVNAGVSRIQFTPDLLPSDVVGTMVYNPKTTDFEVKKGPIFSPIIIADEINRAPAKVQSALLEAMQEKQVTIGNNTFALPQPFWVLATQNPLEQEGTYPLPEAQLDRFLLRVKVGYPNFESELQIVQRYVNEVKPPVIQPVITWEKIASLQALVKQVYASETIVKYVVNIVHATRENAQSTGSQKYLEAGASPRASLALLMAAKAHAFLKGRSYVLPEDVTATVHAVLEHRVILSFEAVAQNISSTDVVSWILSTIPMP